VASSRKAGSPLPVAPVGRETAERSVAKQPAALEQQARQARQTARSPAR
jgi:hypothetical protein